MGCFLSLLHPVYNYNERILYKGKNSFQEMRINPHFLKTLTGAEVDGWMDQVVASKYRGFSKIED